MNPGLCFDAVVRTPERHLYSHEPPDYVCPFCAMVRGEDNEPRSGQGDVVYRDATTTAWVNGRWWEGNSGAVVVVPNKHVENIYALDQETAATFTRQPSVWH